MIRKLLLIIEITEAYLKDKIRIKDAKSTLNQLKLLKIVLL
jgi:hypothetical protein